MSDTPRTDACEVRFSTLFAGEDAMWVPSKKAKEIERELNAAKADAESWRDQAERFGQQLIDRNEQLNAANERIKQLESDQKRSMSRIMRMEVAGDNLVVCATCDVSDASQFVSAWRRSKK